MFEGTSNRPYATKKMKSAVENYEFDMCASVIISLCVEAFKIFALPMFDLSK
jgi:hypothetical protein